MERKKKYCHQIKPILMKKSTWKCTIKDRPAYYHNSKLFPVNLKSKIFYPVLQQCRICLIKFKQAQKLSITR